jgi:hypothetical protein
MSSSSLCQAESDGDDDAFLAAHPISRGEHPRPRYLERHCVRLQTDLDAEQEIDLVPPWW